MFAIRLTRKQLCIALAAVTMLLYLPMLRHGFVNYDDPDYITVNAHVTSGLTWTNIVWAFTSRDASNWHPLTWISHMMDCQLFGVNPAGHHLTNLLFHTANTLLLFILLNQLTGAMWRSAFVAALFAWHPLHVESIAWASERKDVLSAFFWMLTLIAYTHYARSRVESRESRAKDASTTLDSRPSTLGYFLALFFFAMGLMSKPMVVTLPFVLLLVDFWPLQRFNHSTIQRLLVEKIPFFALSLASCLVTYSVQSGALWSTQSLTLHFRVANALMSYVRYISKIFWPTDLAVIYPYPHYWPLAGVISVAALLVMLSVIFILQAKRFPYLAVGWFWYLGTLVPAIGLVQVGVQSMADRYTYLPSIGIFILVAWGLNDLSNLRQQKNRIAARVASLALAGCLAVTLAQLKYWHSSIELFWHTIKVTTDNYAGYDCFGKALESIGKTKEAGDSYAEAVRIEPDYPSAQFNLGMNLLERGNPNEASNHLAIAVQLAPHNPVMQFDFATYLLQHGNPADAAVHFKAALVDRPDFPEARQQLDQLSGKSNSTPAHSTQ